MFNAFFNMEKVMKRLNFCFRRWWLWNGRWVIEKAECIRCFFLIFGGGSKQPWHALTVLFTCTSELEPLDFFYLFNQRSPLWNNMKQQVCCWLLCFHFWPVRCEWKWTWTRGRSIDVLLLWRRRLFVKSRDRKPLRKDIMLILTRMCLFGKDVQKIVYFGF